MRDTARKSGDRRLLKATINPPADGGKTRHLISLDRGTPIGGRA